VTLFVFPTIAAIPYHFTENLYGYWDWALPALILCTGTLLNAVFTKKMPLIMTWVAAFVLQAVIRHFIYPTWLICQSRADTKRRISPVHLLHDHRPADFAFEHPWPGDLWAVARRGLRADHRTQCALYDILSTVCCLRR